ncbi:MAG: argininosuccinate synthase [Rhodospirillales bacterium]|nr:argininosuccinate synthase [Rhodospirillales bacterium]
MKQSQDNKKNIKKVVLAYSGGLDTSIILTWIKENYDCEIITYTGDVGQGDELDGLEAKAKKTGASHAVIEDLTAEFARDYLWPALRAGAIYEGRYLLGTSLARPILAARQVEIARRFGADAVAHGCTGKGNDQLRFELTYRALGPDLSVIAPWREWELTSREDCLAYAESKNIPVPVKQGALFSRDKNLWHISHEGECLEDPWCAPPKDLFQLTTDPVDAPNTPEQVVIGFAGGLPVSLNGVTLEPHALLAALNEIAGKHGVGRIDIVENRVVGLKSRGVYETPGGTVLMAALRDLEGICLDGASLRERMRIGEVYADLVYKGLWFTPLREALDASVQRLMQPVTGEVRVQLFKGQALPTGRRSEKSLYRMAMSTFGAGAGYNQADAAGFIRLLGLPLEAEMLRDNIGSQPQSSAPAVVSAGKAKPGKAAAKNGRARGHG